MYKMKKFLALSLFYFQCVYGDQYTIVLVPPSDSAIKYVEASQALYSHYQPNYLLSDDGKSSPHITVVQFNCDSPETAYQVWGPDVR